MLKRIITIFKILKIRGVRRIMLLCLLSVLIATLFFQLQPVVWGIAARHWHERIAEADDRQAQALIHAIAGTGQPGIAHLAELLGSDREAVAHAAENAIGQQIDAWGKLDARQSSRRVAVLADALAEHAESYGPTSRTYAAQVARQLMQWPIDSDVVDRPAILQSCSQVMDATVAERRMLASSFGLRETQYATLGGASPDRQYDLLDGLKQYNNGPAQASTGWTDREMSVDELAELDLEQRLAARSAQDRLADATHPLVLSRRPAWLTENSPPQSEPSGGFDSTTAPVTAPVSAAVAAQVLDDELSDDEPSSANTDSGSIDSDTTLSRTSQGRSPSNLALDALQKLRDTVASTDSHRSQSADAGNSSSGSVDIAQLTTLELMRRLHNENRFITDQVEQELRRRGFSETHLQLARKLFSPDPAVRTRLAAELFQTPGINPHWWLDQLAADTDADVRYSVYSLMATSGDPVLMQAVRAKTRSDADPRIREIAQRLDAVAGERSYR